MEGHRGLEGHQGLDCFNEAHQRLFLAVEDKKERIQKAFQSVFEQSDLPQLGRLLTGLGNAVYDAEDLEVTVNHYMNKCRGTLVYVVILDLQVFVDALTDLVDVLDELFPGATGATNVELLTTELLAACDQVRTAASNLKFIRTPVKPEAHELLFNDQD